MSDLSDNPTTVSVVIPAYGECPHLPDVIAAIYEGSALPLEVIVSHSGPNDPSEALKARFSELVTLHDDGRLLGGAARNRGAAIARGDIFAFCDADTLPAAEWLAELIEGFRLAPGQFVVGAVAMERRGGYWGMANWLSEFSEQAPWRPFGMQVGGASCNMALLGKDFLATGGFREDIQPGEDTTLFADLRNSGLKQVFVPKAIVGHINNPGFAAFVRHQKGLGAAFAEVRNTREMSGSFVARYPALALLLCAPKAVLVLRRTLFSGLRPAAVALFLSPGIILGSLIWCFACYRRSSELRRGKG